MTSDNVKFFKALGEETRLLIVRYLLSGERCVCEFAPLTGKDQTTVSRHLRILVEGGVLDSRKVSRFIYYRIKNEEVMNMLKSFGVEAIEKPTSGIYSNGRCSNEG